MNRSDRNLRALAVMTLTLLLAYPYGVIAESESLVARIHQDRSPNKRAMSRESRPLPVKLNVSVMNSSNRPVDDVGREDFQIFEDDVMQTITSFSRQAGPVSYGVLIDNSGSLRTQITKVIDAGNAVVDLMEPEDEAFLLRFISAGKIHLVSDWTTNKAKLKGKIEEMYPEGGVSAIIDAVYIGSEHIAKRKKVETSPRRYALILITDGEERNSYYTLDKLLNLLRETDLQIFVIGFVNMIEGNKVREKAVNFLHTLAYETSGRLFLTDGKLGPIEHGSSPTPVDRTFLSNWRLRLRQIAAEITLERHAQYVVGYNSTKNNRDGSFRKVRVTINDKPGRDKRIAMSRAGYTAPSK